MDGNGLKVATLSRAKAMNWGQVASLDWAEYRIGQSAPELWISACDIWCWEDQ